MLLNPAKRLGRRPHVVTARPFRDRRDHLGLLKDLADPAKQATEASHARHCYTAVPRGSAMYLEPLPRVWPVDPDAG